MEIILAKKDFFFTKRIEGIDPVDAPIDIHCLLYRRSLSTFRVKQNKYSADQTTNLLGLPGEDKTNRRGGMDGDENWMRPERVLGEFGENVISN